MSLVHPVSSKKIVHAARSSDSPILIVGSDASGRDAALSLLLASALDRNTFLHLRYDAASNFGIDEVRELWKELAKKISPGQTRLVTIDNGHALRHEAQNALLKTLEEPPAMTLLILLADQADNLLPTIRSRVRLLHVLEPTLEQYYSLYNEMPQELLALYYRITDGRPAQMKLLAESDVDSKGSLDRARGILSMNTYQRLAAIDGIVKDKELSVDSLLDELLILCRGALHKTAAASSDAYRSWLERSSKVLEALTDLRKNGNAKIILTDLFMSL